MWKMNHLAYYYYLLFIIFINCASAFQHAQSLKTTKLHYPFAGAHSASFLPAQNKENHKQTHLSAKKKNNKSSGGFGGGFGSGGKSNSSTASKVPTVSADKDSLEKQWDIFASITDLEITPKGDPEDEDYVDFEVADVFVKCAKTKWFRIGKVCTSGETAMEAALTLQKGLIFWTAVHMRMELVAAGGKSGAASLELGYMPATMVMGSESDGSVEVEEGIEDEEIVISTKSSSVKDAQAKTFGFRPDWNPPGFTYKRREKAAMKKKVSKLDEMMGIE
uniref:Uncharacterized protein n=2 Tax=Ditylum brightwellii TaxID=49249 RepID=A0A6U3SA92_9STRA|mmetsp:Transcript_22581/g.33591  ORF Transcript_22581/g.33591 Transcript_22581/m.33591 type:complete len:277 (+) Transcript_22581:79-909(+)